MDAIGNHQTQNLRRICKGTTTIELFSILNIDEESVATEGGYPFPRKRLAQIQNDLLAQGALGVGWVISFPQNDRFGGDLDFAKSLAAAPSVLATFENAMVNTQ